MRFFLFVTLSTLFGYGAVAQQQPVHWTYSVKKLDNSKYELHITAQIENGWHIYSQKQPEGAIAQPTVIKLVQNPMVRLSGDVAEIGQMEKYNVESLGIEQYQYSNKIDFVQIVELKNQVRTTVTGSVTFQVCTDKLCLAPKEEKFNLAL